MRNLLISVGLIGVLACGAAYVGFRANSDPALHAAVARGDTMEWLRTDFHLDGEQLAAIRRLQDAYSPSCDEHCRMIQEATQARRALEAAHGDPASIAAANERIRRMRSMCEGAIRAHVEKVAALMATEDAKRYLALVLPKISKFDHNGAPDLRLNTSS